MVRAVQTDNQARLRLTRSLAGTWHPASGCCNGVQRPLCQDAVRAQPPGTGAHRNVHFCSPRVCIQQHSLRQSLISEMTTCSGAGSLQELQRMQHDQPSDELQKAADMVQEFMLYAQVLSSSALDFDACLRITAAGLRRRACCSSCCSRAVGSLQKQTRGVQLMNELSSSMPGLQLADVHRSLQAQLCSQPAVCSRAECGSFCCAHGRHSGSAGDAVWQPCSNCSALLARCVPHPLELSKVVQIVESALLIHWSACRGCEQRRASTHLTCWTSRTTTRPGSCTSSCSSAARAPPSPSSTR